MHTLTGGGFRVTFDWQGDRFGHAVELLDGDRSVPLLESVEGLPDETWPASPPFQQLHIERQPGGSEVALLVGMAGTSHWSASIELDPAAGEVTFDVACRAHSAPATLASTYRASGTEVEFVSSSAGASLGALLLGAGEQHARLHVASVADQPMPSLDLDRDLLAIRPIVLTGPWPATLRWRYRIARMAR